MTVTIYVLIGTAIGLIGFDIWRYTKSDESTISEVLYRFAKRYPLIPFLFGMLMAHLFWAQ